MSKVIKIDDNAYYVLKYAKGFIQKRGIAKPSHSDGIRELLENKGLNKKEFDDYFAKNYKPDEIEYKTEVKENDTGRTKKGRVRKE